MVTMPLISWLNGPCVMIKIAISCSNKFKPVILYYIIIAHHLPTNHFALHFLRQNCVSNVASCKYSPM